MKTADPLSNVYPSMTSDETLPPGVGCDSSRIIELFDDSSDAAAIAADRPLIPPPMMHMSTSSFDELSRVFWIWIDCNDGAKAETELFVHIQESRKMVVHVVVEGNFLIVESQ